MASKTLITGLVGSVVAALCCFTPILPAFLGAVGAGALIPILYRDAVLLPLLAVFLLIAEYGFWRGRRRR